MSVGECKARLEGVRSYGRTTSMAIARVST